MSKSAETLFTQILHERAIPHTRTEDGRYALEIEGSTLLVSLENIQRTYMRESDPDVIEAFVESLLEKEPDTATLDWQQVCKSLRFVLEPGDYEGGFEGVVHRHVTQDLVQVLCLVRAAGRRIVWVNTSMLESWDISQEDAITQTAENMRVLTEHAHCEVEEVKGFRLGMISTEEMAFKASLILSPGFKALVEPRLGWPVFAVAPCRDFLYVIPQSDQNLLGYLGSVVLREYNESGYPITKDILRITDGGVQSIGTFRG